MRHTGETGTSQWSRLAQFGLGWAYYRQTGRCEESVSAFEQYLRLSADHRTEALFAQGSCLMRLGREREARLRFEEIMSQAPEHPLALESGFVIVDMDRREERFTQAKELLHRFLRRPLDSTSRAQVQLRLGAIALEQGNAAQAKTIWTLAMEQEEPSIRQSALTGLGDAELFLGDVTSAQRFYEEAIQLSAETPLASYAAYQVGRIHLQVGALDEAIAIFQRLAAHEDSALADDARLALVIAYLHQKEEALARALLDAIRQQRPTSLIAARAAYYEALLALGEDDERAAQRLCEELIAKAPLTDEAFEARLLLADLRARASSPREVMAWLQQVYASERLPRGHRAKLAKRLGDLARSDQGYAEALRWYESAIALLPSLRGEGVYRMASCYEEAGDLEVAVRWYQKIEQPPWHVRGQLAAAKLLERQDRPMEAKAIYERLAAEPIPESKLVQERLAAYAASTRTLPPTAPVEGRWRGNTEKERRW